MQVVRSKEKFASKEIKELLKNSLVGLTVGNFDCLHLGHQKLFEELSASMEALNSPKRKIKILISFYPHPKRVFSNIKRDSLATKPEVFSFLSFEQRFKLIEKAGFDFYFLARFTKEFAALEPEDFLRKYLLEPFDPELIVVGDDWCFGKERSGTPEKLCEFSLKYRFQAKIIKGQNFQAKRISTTLIKELLASDKIAEVKNYLGRNFSLLGKVVHGDKRGRQIGFPTANLNINFQVLPTNGVYACKVNIHNSMKDAVVNIGVRPTFKNSGRRVVEVHIIGDNSYELYGRKLEVEFVEKIRNEMKFSGVEELKKQIQQDIESAKKLLHG